MGFMRSTFLLLIAPVLFFAGFQGVIAETLKPEDEITYRQSSMMFMRWNMGTIKQHVVSDQANYDAKQVITAAKAINAVADTGFISLFSENSKTGKGWGKTKVKPEFFQQPEKVREKSEAFKREAKAMVESAQGGNLEQMKTQFDKLFESCKSCHKEYREKD